LLALRLRKLGAVGDALSGYGSLRLYCPGLWRSQGQSVPDMPRFALSCKILMAQPGNNANPIGAHGPARPFRAHHNRQRRYAAIDGNAFNLLYFSDAMRAGMGASDASVE
jgi:hypothetical protein